MTLPFFKRSWARSPLQGGLVFATLSIGAVAFLPSCEQSPEFGSFGAGAAGTGAKFGGGGDDGGFNLDGTGSTGSGTGSTGAGSTSGCAESTGDADQVPSSMLFVIDKSGSMNCNEPQIDPSCSKPIKVNTALKSKWEMTREALIDSFGSLNKLTGLSAGLVKFPVDNFCGVLPAGKLTTEVKILDQAQTDVLTSALEAIVPEGETPLAGAGIRGLEALRQRVVAGKLPGRVFMVLMTDGAETCQPAALDQLVDDVKTAREGFGIQTFVIGAPGSEQARALLSELAFQGGTAHASGCAHGGNTPTTGDCHFDMTETVDFSTDLTAALTAITDTTALTCEFDIPPGALVDPTKVNVTFTPSDKATETIPQDAKPACDTAEGWQFSKEQNQVVLCGDVCDRVKSDPGGKVRVVFGCKTTIIR